MAEDLGPNRLEFLILAVEFGAECLTFLTFSYHICKMIKIPTSQSCED